MDSLDTLEIPATKYIIRPIPNRYYAVWILGSGAAIVATWLLNR